MLDDNRLHPVWVIVYTYRNGHVKRIVRTRRVFIFGIIKRLLHTCQVNITAHTINYYQLYDAIYIRNVFPSNVVLRELHENTFNVNIYVMHVLVPVQH